MIQIKWRSEPVDWWDDPDLQYLAHNIIALLALCGFLLLLGGCGPTAAVSHTTDLDKLASASVSEITLSDGTKCAVYRGYKAGGISCNWQR